MSRMPTWFLPHGGGPCFFMEWNPPGVWDRMGDFLRGVAATVPRRPQAIVLVSAHWQGPAFSVTSGARPGLIYDYYGFPPHTYALQYPAPGDPAVAQRVQSLLGAANLPVQADAERDFDHGMFIPLMLCFPPADIPVVQLSLHHSLDPALHLRAGAALAPLRDDGVLIIGSGMSFHNLRARGNATLGPVSDAFDQWLLQAMLADPAQRQRSLTDWASAPGARLCHPPGGEEHLLPLMVAVGAAGQDPGHRNFNDRVMDRTLSAFCFG